MEERIAVRRKRTWSQKNNQMTRCMKEEIKKRREESSSKQRTGDYKGKLQGNHDER